MSIRETEEFRRGEEFERALSHRLQRNGFGVVPVYNYSGDEQKAPKLERLARGLVLPDLFAVRAGVSTWCEAKRKTHADWTRITQRRETGIDARLFTHYREVKKESGLNVYLFFGHDEENEVRFCEIDEFAPRHSPNFNNGKGGYFWPYDELHVLAPLDELLDTLLVAA